MSKSLALLSGKGGSGKTTLALSVASMLSTCRIKVLLIDCDLCTNGATYFYESRLSNQNTMPISFYDILFNPYITKNNFVFININSYFDFLPSIFQISESNTKTYSYREQNNSNWITFYQYACYQYDVVLFDCQAGYTDVLKVILPFMDINLFVMEADAISSSAIRSLYLKIANLINDKNVYQLFNKATDEEYEIYSKISGGTVFTNIETITFDWKIRRAFAVAQIPDMKNTSADYGKQIYNVCKILLTDVNIQNKIEQFNTAIVFKETLEKEKEIRKKIKNISKEIKIIKKRRKKFFLLSIPLTFLCIITFYMLIDEQFTKMSILIVLMVIINILFSYLLIYEVQDQTSSLQQQYKIYKNNLELIMKEKDDLENDLENSEYIYLDA